MSKKRIEKELCEIKNDPPNNWIAGPIDESDIYNWTALILGPEDSPYQEGVFFISIHFTEFYPFRPPKVLFTTKIYHLNITTNGHFSVDFYEQPWNPLYNISLIMSFINDLLVNPNPSEPWEPDIARIYKNDRQKYEKTAKEWTKRFSV